MTRPTSSLLRHPARLSALAAILLAGCGGGADPGDTAATDATSPAPTSLSLPTAGPALPDDVARQTAMPTFHAAPLLLDAPGDTDTLDPAASANHGPRVQTLPPGAAAQSTRGLTVQALEAASRARALSADPAGAEGRNTPLGAASTVSVYTPAQVRAAYGLPPLPPAGTKPTATQAAQMGAGQTIYIVNAFHDPQVAAELAAFNQKFGLPACTLKPIAVNAPLPLAAPNPTACELSVAYATPGGTRQATAPAYDAGWATEIALDVQWAHATAPLARIVLIEAVDASLNSLLGAIRLANAMGPGVVSMSFGAAEGSWTASVDSVFSANRMSYLAATGDWGAGVMWPSVSANVVAVGGTTLSYTGSGPRSEVAWSGTGGGTSAYVATPAYQTAAVPGLGQPLRRTLADVAFNADPSSGQYIAVMTPGRSTVSWLAIGGTSLSTPQWAGLLAVANALRAQAARPVLGAPHAVLYGPLADAAGGAAGAFTDITEGRHGDCSNCTAHAGHDPLTGLGTPNAGALLSALAGTALPPVAPTVASAKVSAQAGTAWAYTLTASGPNPLSFSLAGAPAGMTVSAGGVMAWARPVAGTHAVTVTVRDATTGLSASAQVTVQVAAAATGPTIAATALTGVSGRPLTGRITLTAPGASSLRISVSGVPAGMVFSMSGLTLTASWPRPVTGRYTLQLSVVDSAGRSASAAVPVTITAK